MEEAYLNQFMRLRNQRVIAPEKFGRDENMSPVLIPTLSKHMDEQLKVAHQVVDVVDRSHENIRVTLPRYNVEKPESSNAQIRILARKKEDEKL